MQNNKRTICFCNSTQSWGGGEVWHFQAALSFARRGWRVLFICRHDSELYARLANVPEVTRFAFRIGKLSFLDPVLRLRLVHFFRSRKVHALVMNLPSDLKTAGPAAKAAGVEHIVYRRGSALPVSNSVLNRYLFGSVITRLVANSQATKDMVLVNNPSLIPQERISVIPNGIDISAFDAALAAAADPRFFPELGNGATRPLILGNAARLNRQKAQHLLLALGAKLMERSVDFRILIAGKGEREQELKHLAKQLGVEDKTCFAGFMTDLSPFWRAIDVFVLTSLWEGFGNVVIEAGLARKPVFCFAVSNLPELITDGVNGKLFPVPETELTELPQGSKLPDAHYACTGRKSPHPDSLDLLADALTTLANNRDSKETMGACGRTMALQYAQDECMEQLEVLLK
ncbi:glycosyltransferase [Desulfovibrio sp. OttesenSCG-928-G15]|nr:glycosyltransferase [Desulfovibrio sp. OttesenSCG-928-G15]